MKYLVLKVVPLLLVAALGSGCAKRYIANTDIEDTPENRDIIEFCERYRHAVEDLNIGLILSMASPRYFDNSGTVSGDDDYDRTGLEEVLKERFKAISALRYEFKYRAVYEVDHKIFVEYTYTMSFQYQVGEDLKWANRTEDNRLELERIDEGFLVVSGM